MAGVTARPARDASRSWTEGVMWQARHAMDDGCGDLVGAMRWLWDEQLGADEVEERAAQLAAAVDDTLVGRDE